MCQGDKALFTDCASAQSVAATPMPAVLGQRVAGSFSLFQSTAGGQGPAFQRTTGGQGPASAAAATARRSASGSASATCATREQYNTSTANGRMKVVVICTAMLNAEVTDHMGKTLTPFMYGGQKACVREATSALKRQPPLGDDGGRCVFESAQHLIRPL